MNKTKRVGSFTLGLLLISTGIVFTIYMFLPKINLEFLLAFWPVLLIALGVEVLVTAYITRKNGEDMKYDFGAVVLMAIVCLSSFVMAGAYFVLENADYFLH